jgi:hypothetical protein
MTQGHVELSLIQFQYGPVIVSERSGNCNMDYTQLTLQDVREVSSCIINSF